MTQNNEELTDSQITEAEKRAYKSHEERRREILEVAVAILSEVRQEKFSTKEIAARLDMAEASFYRHFQSKSEVLSELVAFCDSAFTAMFNDIDARSGLSMVDRALVKVQALLAFAQANPGITRILTGEALVYESPLVQKQMRECIARAQKSIASSLRLAVTFREIRADYPVTAQADLMVCLVEGRWKRFTQSDFTQDPTEGFEEVVRVFSCRD